jgi:uncharacterized MAPEG superfamily protein
MGRIDIICGLFTGAFSLLFYIGTLSFPDMSIGINPRAYPMVIIVAAFALSLLLVVQGAKKLRREKGEGQRILPRGRTARLMVMLSAAMLAYALSMEDLGYIIVTPFLAALTMWLFGERKALKILAVSLLATIVLYWVFRFLFRVPLPRSFIW